MKIFTILLICACGTLNAQTDTTNRKAPIQSDKSKTKARQLTGATIVLGATGAYLIVTTEDDKRDIRTTGFVLVGLAVVTGVLAVIEWGGAMQILESMNSGFLDIRSYKRP